jgi:sugar phosphate isomerase/epimerase
MVDHPAREDAMVDSGMPLTLWAACVAGRGLLERSDAVAAGGFAAMTAFTGDVLEYEQTGGSLPALRRELAAREAPITTIDPYFAWYPGFDPSVAPPEVAKHFEATTDDLLRYADDLGATYISVLGPFFQDDLQPPFDEVVESLGAFVDRAAAAGLRPHLEIVPTTKIPDLATGLALVRAVNRPNLGLLLDTYNLARTGLQVDELDDVPHEVVFQIQVADAPREPRGASFWEEATGLRELPGEGELPVAEMLERLARKGPLPPTGPEVFQAALGALAPAEAGQRSAETTRAVLARAGALATAGGG